VSPDLGRDRVSVVPQVPAGQPSVAGRNVVLGKGSADVTAWASGTQLRTDVKVRGPRLALTIGAVLPAGASVKSVSLDGHGTAYQLVNTTRGTEVHVSANGGSTSSLRITLN
jgi:hypothetical protein